VALLLRREIFDSGTTQKKYFSARAHRNWQARAAYSAGATNRPRPSPGDFEESCQRFNDYWRNLTMHDQRKLTQDVVLRAQLATANRLIAEQSAAIARAHSAIERAMEGLRDGEGKGRLPC
jgi:hypothetical protein